jgi:hypothetical protein
MGRTASTIFNPSLGLRYYVKDLKTGKKVNAKTLSPKSVEHLPIRSNKDTPKGQEFFKMEIQGEVHKFMNSIKRERCLSENGRWEFIGLRPNGEKLSKNSDEKKYNKIEDTELEFVSNDLIELLGRNWNA